MEHVFLTQPLFNVFYLEHFIYDLHMDNTVKKQNEQTSTTKRLLKQQKSKNEWINKWTIVLSFL